MSSRVSVARSKFLLFVSVLLTCAGLAAALTHQSGPGEAEPLVGPGETAAISDTSSPVEAAVELPTPPPWEPADDVATPPPAEPAEASNPGGPPPAEPAAPPVVV